MTLTEFSLSTSGLEEDLRHIGEGDNNFPPLALLYRLNVLRDDVRASAELREKGFCFKTLLKIEKKIKEHLPKDLSLFSTDIPTALAELRTEFIDYDPTKHSPDNMMNLLTKVKNLKDVICQQWDHVDFPRAKSAIDRLEKAVAFSIS